MRANAGSADTFNVSKWKVDAWVTKTQKEGMDNGTVVITSTVSTIGGYADDFFYHAGLCIYDHLLQTLVAWNSLPACFQKIYM